MLYVAAFAFAVLGRPTAAKAAGRNRCGRSVYSIDWGCEKPPIANRAPRSVEHCDANSHDWQQFGCRAASQRPAGGL
jgi:hypothetical protein